MTTPASAFCSFLAFMYPPILLLLLGAIYL